MKIVTMTGNHPRHLWIANQIAASFDLAGAVLLKREAINAPPEASSSTHDQRNMRRHFDDREAREAHYFSGVDRKPATGMLEVSSIEDPSVVSFVKNIRPDAVLIFGTGLVKSPLFDLLPTQTINLHLGLSPRYRGAATLFWPFYFLEPAFAGTTLHRIVAEPDAGDILHQSVPVLARGDGIHDIGCKAVIAAGRDAVRLLSMIDAGSAITAHRQRGTGKNFLSSDFRPEHLRQIYDVFENRVVDAFLDGTIEQRKPKLVRQFD